MKLSPSTAHRQPTPLLAALVLAALRLELGQEEAREVACAVTGCQYSAVPLGFVCPVCAGLSDEEGA